MSKFIVPFISKAEDRAPLQRCVQKAADKAGLTEYQVARSMTFLLEGIVAELCQGNIVRIPGFGAFGPVTYESLKHPGTTHCFPRFSSARPFINEVAMCCLPSKMTTKRMLYHRRKNNYNGTPVQAGSLTMTTMHTMRQAIDKQERLSKPER